MNPKLKAKSDFNGRLLNADSIVRVCAVPNLKGVSVVGVKESLPIFQYAVGKKFPIIAVDSSGFVELELNIPFGPQKGMHTLFIESYLLQKLYGTSYMDTAILTRHY